MKFKVNGDELEYPCPGCQAADGYYKSGHRITLAHTWSMSGSFESPTISPSVLARTGSREHPDKLTYTCHHFIRNGKIEYLSDCSHPLAGKTVDMLDIQTEGKSNA